MLEDGLYLRTDPNLLLRIAEQVADQADIVGMRQFHQDDDVGAVSLERRVHRVPDALPTKDAAASFDRLPSHVEGVTAVADPLRPPLPAAAALAALHHEDVFFQTVPIRGAESVRFGGRDRKTFGQIEGSGVHQSVASEPKMQQLTGVTIGPAMTMDTSTFGTWLVDSPRIWRTASICSSS